MMANESRQLTSNERDPFGLAGLSGPQPPRDAWPQIESRLRGQNRFRRAAWWTASAATLILAAGLFWQFSRFEPRMQPAGDLSLAAPEDEGGLNAETGSLESLISLSRHLENNLRLTRQETGAIPAQSVVYLVELEDFVAQLDEAISRNPQSRELWSQRVSLLLDLNTLYREQLRREYSQVASL